jgi:hypothetical protein
MQRKGHTVTAELDPSSAEGRPIKLTPVPGGVWLVILGSGVTVLAPLFGFLIGSVLGTEDQTFGMSSIFLFLFLGFLTAGAGLGLAILGVRRILRNRRTTAN